MPPNEQQSNKWVKPEPVGHIHPINAMLKELQGIYAELGFSVISGPELETEFYNFDALNIPANHPSRDMQDTFWLKEKEDISKKVYKGNGKGGSGKERLLLATQTSAMQVRYMESHKPPFRIIGPGKVFRNEATDATHEAQFYQLEALYVDKEVSLGQLKGTLEFVFKKLFGDEVIIRFRPSFFPFVEPALEVDMKWKDKWLEVCGAGMVHPNVFKAAGIDSKKWKGFAFALGIDRLVMLRHGIDDIRLLYSGDMRFVNQF